MTPHLRTLSVECRSRTVPQVFRSLRPALRDGKDLWIELRNLGLLEGSISSLLLQIVGGASRGRTHATLEDRSGFASAMLDILGGTEYVRARAS